MEEEEGNFFPPPPPEKERDRKEGLLNFFFFGWRRCGDSAFRIKKGWEIKIPEFSKREEGKKRRMLPLLLLLLLSLQLSAEESDAFSQVGKKNIVIRKSYEQSKYILRET